MLSGQGWLTENLLTGGAPFAEPLPEDYVGLYWEGGDGTILGATELDFSQINVLFEQSFIRERFGYGIEPGTGDYTRVLTIELVQANVFGVLLLDSFTPPAIANEFFEFAAYTQLACVDGITASTPIYGSCQSGEEVDVTEVEGSTVSFSEVS